MKKLNVPTAIIFGLLSLVNVATGDWLAATASGLLAAGFLLSDLAYAPALAPGTAAAPRRRRGRPGAATALWCW